MYSPQITHDIQFTFDPNAYYGVILINYFTCDSDADHGKSIHTVACSKAISIMLTRANIQGRVFQEKNRYRLLLCFSNCREGKVKISELADSIANMNPGFQVGVGSLYHTLANSDKSHEEAMHCLELLSNYPIKTRVLKYAELGIFRVLSKEKERTYNYIMNMLLPVLEYDQRKKSDLWLTLQVYVGSNRALNVVSKQMHMHINTAYYRIKKIQELLDVDFSNPNQWFEIQVVCNLVTSLNLDFSNLLPQYAKSDCSCNRWTL